MTDEHKSKIPAEILALMPKGKNAPPSYTPTMTTPREFAEADARKHREPKFSTGTHDNPHDWNTEPTAAGKLDAILNRK